MKLDATTNDLVGMRPVRTEEVEIHQVERLDGAQEERNRRPGYSRKQKEMTEHSTAMADTTPVPTEGAELRLVRQIAFELLRKEVPHVNLRDLRSLAGEVSRASGAIIQKETVRVFAEGFIITTDGASTGFRFGLELSRDFIDRYRIRLKGKTSPDPLMIEFDAKVKALREKQVQFDLNSPDLNEKDAFLEGNTGFLTLDLSQPRERGGYSTYDEFSSVRIPEFEEEEDSGKLSAWKHDEEQMRGVQFLPGSQVGAAYLRHRPAEWAQDMDEEELKDSKKKSLPPGAFINAGGDFESEPSVTTEPVV